MDYTRIYYYVDEFVKLYEGLLLEERKRRTGKLSLSEEMSILIFYHLSCYRDLKNFYKHVVEKGDMFPNAICYDRYIQKIPSLFVPLTLFLHILMDRSERTGIYYADSTHFAVCHNRRISRHKTFEGFAERSKNTMGWFYGFKLHMVINDKKQIVAVRITKGNLDDRDALLEIAQAFNIRGKCYADKGYIGKEFFHNLWNKGLQIITSIKRNMKNRLFTMQDKILLSKRKSIETIFGNIKECSNFKAYKHRSPTNAFSSLIAAISAKQLQTIYP